MSDDFLLTNLELRASTETGEQAEGLSHRSMEGMVLLTVRELAASGEPRGAVTIVHDVGDHGQRYADLARELTDQDWAVALPDLRGHGTSEGERGHSAGIREVERDLSEIQDHLAYRMPDAPKVLVGQGAGALYSLLFALERPGVVQALVLVAPLHDPKFEPPEAPKGFKKFFNKVTPQSPGKIGYQPDQLTSDANQAAAWGADAHAHGIITLRAAEQVAEAAARFLPRVAEAGIPVLIVHGADDPISSVEKSRVLEGAGVDVQVFDGMRHQPLHEADSAKVRAAILSWLDAKVPRAD